MIEALIAITIILTAVVGGLTLMISSFTAEQESNNRIIASNLAREAIEIARNFRDSSWLKSERFDSWLVNADFDYSAVPIYDMAGGEWQLNFLPDDISDADCAVYTATDGFLNNSSAGIESKFRRILILNPICWDPWAETESFADEGSNCPPAEPTIGVRVQAYVKWTERGQTHTLAAEDKLYNWRWR